MPSSVVRRVTGVGLSLGARHQLTPGELRALAHALDTRLTDTTVWVPEGTLNDPFPLLGYLAAQTTGLRLATGVSPMAARSPATAAMAAATLDRVSGGRAVLGLGVGHAGMNNDWYGQRHTSDLAWAEQYLRAVRQILDGAASDVEGSELRTRGFALIGDPYPGLPVAMAALGPRMLDLAGRMADTTLLNWATPEHAAWSRERVTKAASEAGRGTPNVGVYVRIAAGPRAAELAREHTGIFFKRANYVRTFDRMGLTAGDDPVGRTAEALVLSGEPDDIAARLGGWRDAGMDFVALYPIGTGSAFTSACGLAVESLRAFQDDTMSAEHGDPRAAV